MCVTTGQKHSDADNSAAVKLLPVAASFCSMASGADRRWRKSYRSELLPYNCSIRDDQQQESNNLRRLNIVAADGSLNEVSIGCPQARLRR